MVIMFSKKVSLKNTDKQKIQDWLKSRFQNNDVRTLFKDELLDEQQLVISKG